MIGDLTRGVFTRRSIFFIVAALGAVISAAQEAAAQGITPPPRQDTQSPNGVSFRSGSFNYQEKDFSIGGGAPTGLELTRTYNSATSIPNDPLNGVQGWTVNHVGLVSAKKLPVDPDAPPLPGREPYVYTVTIGARSVGFLGGSRYSSTTTTGGPVGTYRPIYPNGAMLVFNGTTSAGYYTFTDSDGSIANFTTGASGKIADWTTPDGTRWDYTYVAGKFKSVVSNRGWAIVADSGNVVCAINAARTYFSSATGCQSSIKSVAYSYVHGTYNTPAYVLSSANNDGETTRYQYEAHDHLSCVLEPGQSTCKTTSTYTPCPEDPYNPNLQAELHYNDYVTSQLDADGKSYQYSYANGASYPVNCPKFVQDTNADYRALSGSAATMMVNSADQTTLDINPAALPTRITDALSHVRTFYYDDNAAFQTENVQLLSATNPEGDVVIYNYDDRGNIVSRLAKAKPGSGLANRTMSADFSVTCPNIKTCNKPNSTIDARGNQTDYTYDPAHGGILTETAPAGDDGIRPVKRYAYIQRSAWIMNASGGYSQAAYPVWLLSTLKTCRTGATVGGVCAAGTGDEIVTTYEYGPNGGPNNLLLRGIAVSADGKTLRTCYGYDAAGNRISETKPNASLAVCP